MKTVNAQRITRVMEQMKLAGLNQLLINDPLSVYYLTDVMNHPFERFWALLLRESGEHVLFSNRLFNVPFTGLETITLDDTDNVEEHVKPFLSAGTVGVDKVLPARFLLPLMALTPELTYVLGSDCVDRCRACKDDAEKALMRKASELNDQTMHRFAAFVHEGVTEAECAAFILNTYRELGCDGVSFDPVVSFGANAADPHHEPDGTVLKEGDCMVVDIGCKKDGYCSDMTRTFFWKSVSERHAALYRTVAEANARAEQLIRPGIPLSKLDAAARNHIAAAGYGEFFTHRLGHFIGMEDHEKGDVSSTSPLEAEAGQIFSIEPGVYLPGEFGCRVEDLVLVTENGAEILNKESKDLTILG